MYLNLQLGNFHVVLGKLAEQAKKKTASYYAVPRPIFTSFSANWINEKSAEGFFLDDESKLRYQTHE
jgi:hypothetical protein